MKKNLLVILAVMLLPFMGQAQRYMGIATSNWSGTNGIYINPASIADSRQKLVIDLFSLNFGVDNNLGTINSSNIFKGLGSDPKLSDIINQNNTGKFNMLLPYAEVRGPGFLLGLGTKSSIALTTRLRAFSQFNNFDRDLYRTTTNANDQENYDINPGTGKFNYTAHGWGELGLTFGHVLYSNGKNTLKGGLTVRYLLGAAYGTFQSDNLEAHYTAANDQLVVKNTTLNLSSNGTAFANGGDIFSNIFDGGGKGVGGDLGFVYEYSPNIDKYKYDMDGKKGIIDRGRNTYKLRLSAAITDVGSIKYNGTSNKTYIIANPGTTSTFNGSELSDSLKAGYSDFRRYAGNRGMHIDSSTASTTVHLPTAIVLGIDYQIVNNLYANLSYIGNIANRDNIGNSYYSQLTLTPRYDIRAVSLGLPLTYNFVNKGFKAGLGVRVGGFIIGTDDILGLFTNSAYGANFYFGVSVPLINNKKPKDSDGDLVSNKKDKCPGVKGVWEFMGCPDPDTDHDGIPDTSDKCPTVAGSKTAMGCPDADLDSIADASDRCPTEAGTLAMGGCPDRDGDGIADIDDACPDQKGLAQFKGCPDSDGDGLADKDDACPNAPGPIANHGCPDTDGDGIADNEDKCPTVRGTVANHGCPEVSIEVKKRLAFAATAIQFETGKTIIKPKSFPLLDEIVKILNDYPDYYMTIDGHTDNVGKPDKNMILSQGRADAVKNYFVGKGIATSRLETHGYGDTQPVASNKTSKGKAQNRRVAMDLKLRQ